MQYSINLQALTLEAFGYAPLIRYQVPPDPKPQPDKVRYELPSMAKPQPDEYSAFGSALPPNQEGTGLLGLPVFQRVEFLAPAGWRRLVLDEPIVQVDRDKLIVTTEIQGRDGTVKEYISQGDYAVTIKGILASDPKDGRYSRRYPEQEVLALQQLCTLAEAIPVTGRLFKLLGIRNLVIKSVSWPALPGFTNLQAYELRCLSDEPIELNTTDAGANRAEAQRLEFAFTPTSNV